MEGLSIHFPHEQYARYTSPDATSAYHNPYGYLSPPYSTPQQLTSEHASTWPTNGLGISQCQTSQSCQDQQNFYATSSGQFHFSVRSQRDSPVTNHSLYSSINAYPIYATVNRNLSYHVFSGYNHAPIHHSPSISIQAAPHVDHKDLNHDFYSYAPPPEGTQVESSQFRYRPDPMQEGKFIVAAPDVVFTVSEQAANVASWESADGQQYHDQHRIHPRVTECVSPQEPQVVSLSTPPISHADTPTQDQNRSSKDMLYRPSSPIEGDAAHCGTTTNTISEEMQIVQPAPIVKVVGGKKPIGRITKTAVSRPTLHCHHCSKTFYKESKLREHESSHDKGTAVCPYPRCKKIYGRQADLARHQRSHHKGHLFPCKFCSKTFNRSDITRRHEVLSCRQRRVEEAAQNLTQYTMTFRQ